MAAAERCACVHEARARDRLLHSLPGAKEGREEHPRAEHGELAPHVDCASVCERERREREAALRLARRRHLERLADAELACLRVSRRQLGELRVGRDCDAAFEELEPERANVRREARERDGGRARAGDCDRIMEVGRIVIQFANEENVLADEVEMMDEIIGRANEVTVRSIGMRDESRYLLGYIFLWIRNGLRPFYFNLSNKR